MSTNSFSLANLRGQIAGKYVIWIKKLTLLQETATDQFHFRHLPRILALSEQAFYTHSHLESAPLEDTH